eukprot:8802220-Alexandrium_andersonii.AAC.1
MPGATKVVLLPGGQPAALAHSVGEAPRHVAAPAFGRGGGAAPRASAEVPTLPSGAHPSLASTGAE